MDRHSSSRRYYPEENYRHDNYQRDSAPLRSRERYRSRSRSRERYPPRERDYSRDRRPVERNRSYDSRRSSNDSRYRDYDRNERTYDRNYNDRSSNDYERSKKPRYEPRRSDDRKKNTVETVKKEEKPQITPTIDNWQKIKQDLIRIRLERFALENEWQQLNLTLEKTKTNLSISTVALNGIVKKIEKYEWNQLNPREINDLNSYS